MGIRVPLSIVGVLFLAQFSGAAGQKPVITVTAAQSTLLENPNVVSRTTTATLSSTRITNPTFTVRSDRIVPSNLTVQYTVSGTALAGKDYQALSGSITIPAGQTSASITVSPINDSEDELDETVAISITATLRSPYSTTRPFLARTTILDDDDVRIIGVQLSPDTVLGGETRDMRITVSGAAPPGGLVISVSSGNSAVVASAQATIAAGTRVGMARLSTSAVSAGIAVPLTATEPNGSTARDTLVVLKEPAVRYVAFRFWNNFGGKEYLGAVGLDSPAPPGGWTVPILLSMVSPAGAALPASAPATVTIPAGFTGTGLKVVSQPVPVHTQVEVRAGSGAGSAARVIEIYPLPRVESIAVQQDPVHSSDSVDVRVRLAEPVGPPYGYNAFYLKGDVPVELPADPRLRFAFHAQETTIRIGTSSVASDMSAVLTIGSYDVTNSTSTASARFTVTPPAPRYVSFRFWDNFGGNDYLGSVGIDAPAPASGLTLPVTLTVVSPAGAPLPATAPATVTVPADRTSVGLRVSSQPVSTHTKVEVKAGSGTNAAARIIDIYPVPKVQSITVAPDPVTSRDTVEVRVLLEEPVEQRNGYNAFVLTGTGPVSVPTNTRARFGQGARETTVRLGTNAVTSPTEASIAATDASQPGTSVAAAFMVMPLAPLPSIAAVSFGSASVVGGTAVPVTVVLSGPVPAGRTLSLNLSTTDPVLPPASPVLTIPAGQSAGTVTVQARTVTQMMQGTLVATVPGGVAVTATLTVHPVPMTLVSFTLNPAQVDGGQPATGTVTISAPAPAGGTVVNLTADQPQAVTTPGTVYIGPGLQSARFTVTTNVVGSDSDVGLSAVLPTGQIGRALRVLAPTPRLASLVFASPTVDAGAEVVGRVDLVNPAGSPVTVMLQVSNRAAASVPPTLSIPIGEATGTFRLTAGSVTSPTPVQVEASVGAGPVHATVTVEPVAPTVTAVNAPASVFGGGMVTVSVSLTTATSSALVVPLSSNDPAIPAASVQIPSGLSNGAVTLRTAAVGTPRSVRIGQAQGSIGTSIQVQPLPIDRVQFPGSIRVGDDLTIEVRLLQPAPAGGLQVPLASSSPAMVALPTFVEVPAGAISATITVRIQPGTDEQFTISAGVSPSALTRSVRVR